MGQLVNTVDDFKYLAPGRLSWVEVSACSMLFLQRPFNDMHLRLLDFCHWHGMPVVVDTDDLLWMLPEGNPAYLSYGDDWKNLASECVRKSECVIASTQPIADYVMGLGAKRAVVIENALPDYYRWFDRPRRKTMLWRGSDYHRHDIDTVLDDFLRVVNAHSDWHIVLTGGMPLWASKIAHKNWKAVPLKLLSEFHGILIDESPAIIVNPLQDHPFNHAKSNIAWIESCIAGGVCLAPDFEQYRLPGCARYAPGEFGDKLEMLIQEADSIPERVVEARAYCDQEFRLSKMNAKRIALFRELVGAGIMSQT